MEPIILASASPRRQEYFRLLGLPFSCIPANVDETVDESIGGKAVVETLALRKVSKAVEKLKAGFSADSGKIPDLWVCGADTVIALEGKIYGKPLDRLDAGAMLKAFQGKTHEVWSAVALFSGRRDTFDCSSVVSYVTFAPLSEGEIEWYLDSGEWQDAAGAYKIQGLSSCFITGIQGSFSSIVGLPLREFYVMLRDNGYPYGG